jgi:hypothetical protein
MREFFRRHMWIHRGERGGGVVITVGRLYVTTKIIWMRAPAAATGGYGRVDAGVDRA